MNTQNNVIIRRMFFASLGTMIFSSISTMLGSLVDGIIISRFLGDGAMASFSVISPIYNINMMLAGILSSGAQVAYSKVIGKGEADRARAVFNICFFVALGLSLILGIFTFFGSDLIGEMFGATGKNAVLLPGASSYLRGLALGFPAVPRTRKRLRRSAMRRRNSAFDSAIAVARRAKSAGVKNLFV